MKRPSKVITIRLSLEDLARLDNLVPPAVNGSPSGRPAGRSKFIRELILAKLDELEIIKVNLSKEKFKLILDEINVKYHKAFKTLAGL